MGGLFAIATFVVMSINYAYFGMQDQYIEATEQFALISRDKEEVTQIITLNEPALTHVSSPCVCDRYLSIAASQSMRFISLPFQMHRRSIALPLPCIVCQKLGSNLSVRNKQQ